MQGKSKTFVGLFLAGVITTAWLSAQVAPVYQVVVGVDPVSFDVAISDNSGKAVTDLIREDITIYEDGQPQDIRDFEPVGIPYSILMMVDRSPRGEKSEWPEFILNSVDLFLKNLRGPDRLAVAAFDLRVAVLVDWRPSRNGNVQKVLLKHSAQPTKLFEALDWASEEMQFIASGPNAPIPSAPSATVHPGRKGVIVYTDGRDTDMYPQVFRLGGQDVVDPNYEVPVSVKLRFNKTLQSLRSGRIPFYFVGVETDRQFKDKDPRAKLPGWVRFLAEARGHIQELASVSGGRAVFPRELEDLLPLYNQIHRDLGSGYHITYNPSRPGDGKLRRIEVRVRNSGLRVYQSRDTYFAR